MQTAIFALEVFGIISFAISGAIVAIDKETDVFGVVFLAITTAFGGGLMRDVIIGKNPPLMFYLHTYLVVCVATALVVFVLAAVFKKAYVKNEALVCNINNIFDAIGIGVFAVSGTKICLEYGPLIAILLGGLSAFGGGMIRDLILREIPFILRKRIYAVATLSGSAMYYLCYKCIFAGLSAGVKDLISTVIGASVVFLIRVLATAFKLNAPKAIIFSKFNSEETEKESESKMPLQK